MRWTRVGPLLGAAFFLAAGTVHAFVQDEGEKTAKDPSEVLAALQTDYRSATRGAREADDPKAKIREINAAFLPKFLDFAKGNRGTEEGFAAATQVLQIYQATEDDKGFDAFFETVLADYADWDQATRFVGGIRGPHAEKRLKRVLGASKNPEVKAAALFTVGSLDWNWGDPKEGAVEKVRDTFEKVVREYPATKAARRAKGNLFEMDHLQVGMEAPDVAFVDADGKERRLSDFRGKTVLLEFWASW